MNFFIKPNQYMVNTPPHIRAPKWLLTTVDKSAWFKYGICSKIGTAYVRTAITSA